MLYLYSEVVMLAIRLPQSIEKRLEKLARRTGRTKTFYVREAILEHLEDLEDLYLAEGALERIRTRYRLPRLRLAPGAIGNLLQHDWPGNVRELENDIDYAVQSCNGKILVSDLPTDLREAIRDAEDAFEDAIGRAETIIPLREIELREVKRALRQCGPSTRSPAARAASCAGTNFCRDRCPCASRAG